MDGPAAVVAEDRPVTGPDGLDAPTVARRRADGEVNTAARRTSRTLGEIVRANVLTRFNAILGTMLVVILVVGPIQDALFGLVLVANALIGIVQEIRAKRTLDALAVLHAPRARVRRDGRETEIEVPDIVRDDLVLLQAGDQVPADGPVRSSDGLEVDESLLTGESDPITKTPGAIVLSGSIVVAGSGSFQATAVGEAAYAQRLATEARRFALVRSELVEGINRILAAVTWAIVPTAALLALSQFRAHEGWREAMAGVVAGVVAMVPEGLVLLTSIAFAVAAVTLARRQVLVQELPAVEGLARVDVVCLDKTGTLTHGSIVFSSVEVLDAAAPLDAALGALAHDEHPNATAAALQRAFAPPGWERTGAVPFSSARKWSAAAFADRGRWVLGAPEMVLPSSEARSRAEALAAEGRRVLVLARTDAGLPAEELPPGLRPVALVCFEERIREDAADTLAYFRDQGVGVRVLSGDSPRTVGAIATRVGLPAAGGALDARHLPAERTDLADLLEEHSVLGRVSPHQKRDVVGALQSRGHVVAMTGDGVNDALALKDADIGIAMGNGAPATRAVAQLVLLDGRFSVMPGVVAEGRRVIANIERVASLFVTKTVYAMLIAVAVGVARWPYPFLPRHLTVVSTVTIGVPAFFLALAPNPRRYVPGFVPRVAQFAVPAGFVAAAATFGAYAYTRRALDATLGDARTVATLVLLAVGLWILGILARPITPLRALLLGGMAAGLPIVLAVPALREFYALEVLAPSDLVGAMVIAGGACALLELGWTAVQLRLPARARTHRFAWRVTTPGSA